MLKLLIADASDVFTDTLAAEFRGEFSLKICHDGEDTLETLLSFRPDALILNLMLPFKDGLTVLQESAYIPKAILAVTPLLNNYIAGRAAALGIQYIVSLPIENNSLRVRLMDILAAAQPKENLAAQVAVHLHALNFHTHLDGYRQLCVGIPIFAKNPAMLLSKDLYPHIAKQFQLSDPRTVEHSIRKSITDAWSVRDPLVWEKYFPGGNEAPSNKVFLCRIAENLKI